MAGNDIKLGDRVEIMPRDNAIVKSYQSRVENVVDEETVNIGVPIAYGYLVKLPLNNSYSFIFYTDRGMFRAVAEIVDYFTEDGIQMMQVKMVSQVEKHQRREFFRYECQIAFTFGAVSEDYDIARDRPKPEMFPALSRDISAGGLCFFSDRDFALNTRVKVNIPLGADGFFTLGILMYRQDMKTPKNRYQYRVMFLDLTAVEKDKIVKYIFTEQRKALKKGK